MDYIGRYNYEELVKKALSPDATKEDVERLDAWFCRYGVQYWNGEYYEIDGTHRLYPIFDEHGLYITSEIR